MLTNYAECERRVLLSEGGYTNDPRDPGGPTNWGITLADARAYWKPNATAADVRAMPRSVAQDIYKSKYWDAVDADDLPAGLDYTVFDYGVNSGVGRAKKVLFETVGGRDMAEALTKLQSLSVPTVIRRINDERLAFLHRLRTWPHFGVGWERRVNSVEAFSLHLAQEAAGPPPPHPESPDPSAKGYDAPEGVNNTQSGTVDPQGTSPIDYSDPPATQVATPCTSIPGPSKAKPWLAGLLGSVGGMEWLHKADDYMATLSTVKFDLQSLNITDSLSWLYAHPFFLLPPIVIGISVWLWQDHKRTQQLLMALQRQQQHPQ